MTDIRVEVVGQVAPGSVLVIRDRSISMESIGVVIADINRAAGHDRWVLIHGNPGDRFDVLSEADMNDLGWYRK